MAQADIANLPAIASASERLKEARANEPHPLHATPEEVVRYVTSLLAADNELAAVLKTTGSISEPEATELRRKRSAVDAAISRQVLLAGRRLGTDRQGALDALNGMFKLGSAPESPLNGVTNGQLVTS